MEVNAQMYLYTSSRSEDEVQTVAQTYFNDVGFYHIQCDEIINL